ncbi:MAG: TonB-dependent receptor [Dysgonamonadaceae bacterium]|nr:TonB-dependent receptor [Dysgonamonadaceae bacterium]
MKQTKHYYILFFLFLFPTLLFAQQNVRGVVLDGNTQEPLPGATVIVLSGDQQFGIATDLQGEFSTPNIPVGRCHVTISMIGYRTHVASNILVFQGRETVLEILLEEDLTMLDELVVTPQVDRTQPINQMTAVSARMLSVEEAHRYAGTMGGDVARMTTGFAGVVAADDTRNDIIIRGNSPRGVLWRLDGFDIPNPNHFGAMSGTGGPIGMINTNQLSNSDFLTGTFPAEFGNATSGVFDLRLRNGNNRRHEFLAGMGMNGFELGAEGPISRETGASYMVNARYSFLKPVIAVMELFNADFDAPGVPEYEDITAKINIPLRNGNLSWMALAGASRIRNSAEDIDFTDWAEGDRGQALNMRNRQLFTGLNYTHRFTPNTRLENRLSYQFFRQNVDLDDVIYPSLEIVSGTGDVKMQEGRLAFMSTLNHRINARNTIRAGTGADLYMTSLYTRFVETVFNDYSGNSGLVRGFASWQHRFNNAFSMTTGVYSQVFALNSDFSVEPRLGLRYELSPRTALSLGSGLHSQIQPLEVYLFEENGVHPNHDLGMNRSWQSALGLNQRLGNRMRLKAEVYYQHLFNIPVTADIPEESILNFGDEMFNNWNYVFINEGTGRNYGVEVTLERFFENNYYFLITGSLFDSKYKGFDGIERRTRFASNFAFNALGGYEWRLGKRNLLSVNSRLSWVGGKRYVPGVVDFSVEGLFDIFQFDYSQAYKRRLPDFFRLDLTATMRQNFNRTSIEYFAEINNVTNHNNILMQFYNANRGRMENFYQFGFMPIGGVRFHF